MRFLLLLLTLTLLPLQFSAAAEVGCCEQVATAQVTHDQHHRPTHVDAADNTGMQVGGSAVFDLDCGTCHANCAVAVTTTALPEFARAGADRIAPSAGHPLPMWPERPYRPQWTTPIGSGWAACA
jgi:cytochrome c5